MSIVLNVHGIARIAAHAYSAPIVSPAGVARMHCQTLQLFDAGETCIAEIKLFLDNPTAALPVGDRSRLDGRRPALKTDATLAGWALV